MRNDCGVEMRYGVVLLALSGLMGCLGEADSPGSGVEVSVAPLSLGGITNAQYTLTITNAPGGAGEVVWSRTLTSDQYGDGAGSLTYVGPCDGGKRHTVTLVLDALYAGSELDASTYENPTPVSLEVDCLENRDVPVRFDITLMRQADQGFFDVAVQFEDIFCSAKLDCQTDSGGDLDLLFNDQARDMTAVLGFACISGESQTWLYMDDLVIDCAGSTLDVRVSPTGLGATTPTTNPNDYLFGAATYRGLGDGGVAYWNVALGLDAAAFAAAGNCTLRTRATASSVAWDQEADGFPFPVATVYPVIEWEAALSSGTGRVCTRHEVGSAEVSVEYLGYLPTNAFTWADTPLYMQHRLTPGPNGGTVLSAGTPICNPSCLNGTCVADDVCLCEAGWDGPTCADPICPSGCSHGGTCTAPNTCDCSNTGYEGPTCEDDLDECVPDLGGCDQLCNNTVGGFECACVEGFVLNIDDTTCDDIDECADNNGGCDQTCTNDSPGRTCSCLPGFVLDPNGTSCNDIDECNDANGGCAQTCTNDSPGRTCSCLPGFVLDLDGTTCNDIDECNDANGGCEQTCFNDSPGRTCGCVPGFVLNADGATCDDIDECQTNNGGCQQTCTNTEGGRTCSCDLGGTLHPDGVSCVFASCSDILAADPGAGSAAYLIDPNGGDTADAISVWCDMDTDGGGWTLVAKIHDGTSGAHRNQAAVSPTSLSSPAFDVTAKLADTTINSIRGSYPNSIFRIEAADGKVDYFRENKAFDALGYTASINQVYATYTNALTRAGVCSGVYNSTFHTGLVGWSCHDSFLYGDNPGFRTTTYQAGRVWVKTLRLGDSQNTAATSCLEIRNSLVGAGDAAYWIDTDLGARRLYCDMSTDSGGWTLVGQMSTRANVYDTWLKSDLNVADLETPTITAGTVSSVAVVGLAVNSATHVRFSNEARTRWVKWPMASGRTAGTWWNHAAGQTTINNATQTAVTVTSHAATNATCYQNVYGIMPFPNHGGAYPAASFNTAGNTATNDLCMAAGVLETGSASGFTTNGNGFDAPASNTDWPNASYNVTPFISVWLR